MTRESASRFFEQIQAIASHRLVEMEVRFIWSVVIVRDQNRKPR